MAKMNLGLKKSDLISIYKLMLLTREFEMCVENIYRKCGTPELPHLCTGQEAIGIGSCYSIKKNDFVLPSLRGRSVYIAKGVPTNKLLAGVLGKADGPSRGKWTSHHLGDLKLGILAGTLMIGSQLPIAVGAALSFKIQKSKQVCLCYFGDGASNRGDFHESLNMASIFKLPVIFICENNFYAIDTPVYKAMAIKDIAIRANSYGMPGVIVDGNDVLAVYKATKDAVELARKGGGPTLIECKTYRFRPHCERLQEDRPEAELKEWLKKCPIKKFRKYLLNKKILTENDDKEITLDIKNEIENAIGFAEKSPYPDPAEIFDGVYSDGIIKEGRLCVR